MTLAGAPVDELNGVVADPARIMAWAKSAKPGELFVYATRCALPVASPGAKAARQLAGQGLVLLTQARVPGGGLRNYRATRTKTPWPVEKPDNDEPAQIDGEAACIDALLPLLTRAARFGLPCPTDAQLARRAQLATSVVGQAMQVMAANGIIRIERVRAPTLRLVTIVETGHRTGMAG